MLPEAVTRKLSLDEVGEFQESVVIDIHLFLDILARNGAVAEAGLAQETPARFAKARYHLL